MPHKKYTPPWPEWVLKIRSNCLRKVVKEAIYARDFAAARGALKYKAYRAVLTSADTTLEQIEYGRIKGTLACRKAADALRKYNTAGECAEPTARKR